MTAPLKIRPVTEPVEECHGCKGLGSVECEDCHGEGSRDCECDACDSKGYYACDPPPAAQRIAEQMLHTLLLADAGGFVLSSGGGVWVRERQIAGHA